MNENTAKLLEQLSLKLGTTSEYLWKVLLRQASIDATLNLINILFSIVFGVILYKIHKKFMKKGKQGTSIYYDYEVAPIVVVIGCIILLVMLIFSPECLSNIINGYFNPEYWALNKILTTIK